MGDMTRLLLLLWAGVTVSTAVDLQKRIIGGDPCDNADRLYHVKVKGGGGWCGGSLISNRWILTAAHCRGSGSITALVGVHPGPAQELNIIDPPEIYNDGRQHDLMLLKLPSSTHIPHITLPDCNHPPIVGAMVQIAGHGSTTLGPNNARQPGESPTLQCAKIKVIDCQNFLNCLQRDAPQFYNQHDYQHLICARTPGVDISAGDSGGGVVYNNMIYGVISFIGNSKTACAAPAAFMNICHQPYLTWIERILARP